MTALLFSPQDQKERWALQPSSLQRSSAAFYLGASKKLQYFLCSLVLDSTRAYQLMYRRLLLMPPNANAPKMPRTCTTTRINPDLAGQQATPGTYHSFARSDRTHSHDRARQCSAPYSVPGRSQPFRFLGDLSHTAPTAPTAPTGLHHLISHARSCPPPCVLAW